MYKALVLLLFAYTEYVVFTNAFLHLHTHTHTTWGLSYLLNSLFRKDKHQRYTNKINDGSQKLEASENRCFPEREH